MIALTAAEVAVSRTPGSAKTSASWKLRASTSPSTVHRRRTTTACATAIAIVSKTSTAMPVFDRYRTGLPPSQGTRQLATRPPP